MSKEKADLSVDSTLSIENASDCLETLCKLGPVESQQSGRIAKVRDFGKAD